jgi:hypothetical protein
MQAKFYLSFVTLFSFILLNAQSALLDSTIYWQWSGSAWTPKDKNIFSYDLQGRIDSNLHLIPGGIDWQYNGPDSVIIYDTNGNLIIKEYTTSGGVYSRDSNTYDALNNQLTCLTLTSIGGVWTNSTRVFFTYDLNNNQIGSISQNWNSGAWVNSFKAILTYDSNNNYVGGYGQEWDTAWTTLWQYTVTYDAYNNETSYMLQKKYNGNWVNFTNYLYTYDANNNLIDDIHQTILGGAWYNEWRGINTYDGNNNHIKMTTQTWTGSIWKTTGQRIWEYNSSNQVTSTITQSWITSSSTWLNLDSTHYYYPYSHTCSAHFTLYPDTTIQHHWFALNQATGIGTINCFWSWGDSTTSTGNTPSHTYSAPAYYNICLTVSDSTGCISTFCDSSTYVYKTEQTMITVSVVSQLPTGISELNDNFNIGVFPNPATTQLFMLSRSEPITEVNFFDPTGILVLHAYPAEVNYIDITSVPAGIYVAEIKTRNTSTRKRWVKM